jgi:SH3 domain-containing protein
LYTIGRSPVKKTMAISALSVMMFWHAPDLYAEDTYYVQSAKAKVMSGATFKSTVLGEVGRGHKFLVSGKEGGWAKVGYHKGDGYVHSLVLLTHPPFEKATAITADEQELQKGFRRRASSFRSAEEERGLDRDDRKGPGHDEKADYESLEKIELFTMSSREVKQFMEEKQ